MGVPVDDRRVTGVRPRDGRLEAVLFADGGELARAGLLVRGPLEPRSSLLDEFGLERTEAGAREAKTWDGRRTS